jgi:hypothetical protein
MSLALDAAVSYLANLDQLGDGAPAPLLARLIRALDAIRAYEQVLSIEMLRV